MRRIPWRNPRFWVVCWIVAATGFAGMSGWSWWAAAHDESLTLAVARDEVLQAGRKQIAALHTVNYRKVDAGLGQWLDVTTGPLHDQLRRTRADSKQRLREAETTTDGKVTAAAVTAVDREAGTARVIATVRIRVTSADGGEPTSKRNRYRATLNDTEAGWKIASLTQIPVRTS